MGRPCDENKPCRYEYFDYQENVTACLIDYDGTDCPYIKPYGKRKYEQENLFNRSVMGKWREAE